MENNRNVRPTKFKCQTKFACKNEYSSFYCKQCKVSFCKKCQSKHNSHKYSELKKIDDEEICESVCQMEVSNLADVFCELCDKRYCWNCFKENDSTHLNSGKYSRYVKDTFHTINYKGDSFSDSEENNFHTILLPSIPETVLIFDEDEHFKFECALGLAKSLNVEPTDKLVVISIIGRTGDGKSHCLNKTFFGGHKVFKTDPGQSRCTVGAWAAVAKSKGYMLIDTEGLQGESKYPQKQKRLLMKILAVSDLVIYRTKDSRLNQEIFEFISDASVAFDKYFREQLEKKAEEFHCQPEMLAPAFLLVHSVDHTELVKDDKFIIDRIRGTKPNKVLSFSTILYEGHKTTDKVSDDLIDYKKLEERVNDIFNTIIIRAPRTCEFIFSCMDMLNQIFNNEINIKPTSVFPDEYFSCSSHCESCGKKCEQSMNHYGRHKNASSCVLTNKLQNFVYLCKACSHGSLGPDKFLVPKPVSSSESTLTGALSYIWRGFVIECEKCGILYKSREYWYGNETPNTHPKLFQKIIHYWPGDQSLISSVHPIGQRCIDSVSELSTEIAKWSNPALKVVKNTIVDAYLPEGMQPNSEITHCAVCERILDTLTKPVHHCRQCTKGVCDICSDFYLDYPKHGKQRVCSKCFENSKQENFKKNNLPEESNTYQIFKYASKTTNILGTLAKAPFSVAKMVAQPSYWQSDSECRKCPLCNEDFNVNWLPIHHCRACGKGVCDVCSQNRVQVPLRGIDKLQRVCDDCFKFKRYEFPSE